MSKIFEAMCKADGEVAEVALPLLTAESTVAVNDSRAGAVDQVVTETAFKPNVEPSSVARPAEADASSKCVLPVRLSADAPLLPFDRERSRAGEQYRVIRTKIIQHPKHPRMLVITSAGSGDGKTVNSINIAGALGMKSDSEVLLVDADFRHPSIGKVLGLRETPGLADVLCGACTLQDAIIHIEQFPNLSVIPAGQAPANPAELLDSPRWSAACEAFRREFRFTIFDAPPIAAVADYDLVQMSCDGVVVIVRPDHTSRKPCLKALELISKDKLIGVVMNCVKDSFLVKTDGAYYYY
jgi:capsular exopolysaccharide synthesis family protein